MGTMEIARGRPTRSAREKPFPLPDPARRVILFGKARGSHGFTVVEGQHKAVMNEWPGKGSWPIKFRGS